MFVMYEAIITKYEMKISLKFNNGARALNYEFSNALYMAKIQLIDQNIHHFFYMQYAYEVK